MEWPADEWAGYQSCFGVTEESEQGATIAEIVSNKFKIDDVDGMLDNNRHVRFDSIIDFPYFLLHALRVFVELNEVSLEKPLGDLLDDKKLISDFKNVISQGKMNGKPMDKENFAQMFIIHLLQTRYLFDKFIIKREYSGEDNEGEWSLKELFTSGQGSKKKAYYSNTKLNYSNEWERTYAPRNKECLMIQSALRVSYTSPKVMHWITELLLWLFNNDDDQNPKLIDAAELIAAQATRTSWIGAIISWVCRPLTSYLISWTICYGKTIRMARKNMRILNLSSVILWSIGTRKIRPKIHLLLGTIRIHLETYALFPDV